METTINPRIIHDWCGFLNKLLKNATSKESVPEKYRKAFVFMHAREGPKILSNQGFFTPTPSGPLKLDGLTSQLARVFHPLDLGISTGGAATGGSSRGMEVDKDFENLVDKERREREGVFYNDLHPYTLRAAAELMKKGLRPFMTQVKVGDVELRIGTALDIMCVDETTAKGGLVNVQIKTGFEDRKNYSRKSRDLYLCSKYVVPSQLSNIQDSHEIRHVLQTMTEHMIVQMSHGQPLIYSMLMVVSRDLITTRCFGGDGVQEIPMSDVYFNLLRRKNELDVDVEVDAVRRRFAVRTTRMNRTKGRKYK